MTPLTTAAAVTHKIVQNGAIEPCQILNSGKFLPIFDAKIDSNYFHNNQHSADVLFSAVRNFLFLILSPNMSIEYARTHNHFIFDFLSPTLNDDKFQMARKRHMVPSVNDVNKR